MSKFLFIISISLLLFLVNGCGIQKQIVVKKQEIPSWYSNPPINTSSELYSIGIGHDRKSATLDALTMLASNLSILVSSKFSVNSTVKEGIQSSTTSIYKNESKSEVKKIRISNYEVLKAKKIGFKKYVVLVKSNKQKLFISMKQEVEQAFNILNSKIAILKNKNMIKQMNFYNNSKKSLSSIPYKLLVMKELNNNFDTNLYLNQYNKINSHYENLLSSITFSIVSNKSADNLKAPIAMGISAKKLNIKEGNDKKHFIISINSKIEKAKAYGFTLARSAIEIKVIDYKGSVIGSNKINLVGQSTQGFKIAKENVAIKLNTLIKKDGIAKTIGLDF